MAKARSRFIKAFTLWGLLTLIVLSTFTPQVNAIIQGSGQIIYQEGTVVTPRNRELRNQENIFTTEASLATNTAAGSQYIIKAAPTRNELIAGTINTAGTLRIYLWSGSSWVSQWTIAVGTPTATARFAIAYQQSSGNAVVMYSRNVATTNEIAYRTWNGTSWATAINYDAVRTTAIVDYIVMKPRAGTDELGFAWIDTNRKLSANYLNGSTMGTEPSTAIANTVSVMDATSVFKTPVVDVAFEEQSGRLFVVYGDDLVNNTRYVVRSAGTSGTWGSVSTATTTTQGLLISLTSRPGTNYLALINHANWVPPGATGDYVEASVWNGSAWTTSSLLAATAVSAGENDVSVAWMTSGGTTKALFLYDKTTTSAGINYFVYDLTGNTFGASQTASNTPVSSSENDRILKIYSNPFNAAEAIVLQLSNTSLFAKKVTFNGTTFAWTSVEPSAVALETVMPTTGLTSGWMADYAYNAFVPTVGLAADVVSSVGVPVASPNATFSAVASNNTCQTATATFGDVTNQRIRVTNTTSSPAWTLSIAPAGGTIANWSATTDSYDFNDPTSAGCGDGADADSLSGQLTINPTAATLVANRTGCTTTNITKGSSAGFSEGVINAITLASGSASAQIDCIWDLYSVPLSQKIPPNRLSGSYSLPMTITLTAS